MAALGHNFQVIINGNQYSVDGTSCAAPVTAGLFALINGQRASSGKSSLGFLNPTLYATPSPSSRPPPAPALLRRGPHVM